MQPTLLQERCATETPWRRTNWQWCSAIKSLVRPMWRLTYRRCRRLLLLLPRGTERHPCATFSPGQGPHWRHGLDAIEVKLKEVLLHRWKQTVVTFRWCRSCLPWSVYFFMYFFKEKNDHWQLIVRTAVHPPFDQVIAGSYKKGSAHHSKSEMYVCSLCNQSFSTQGSLKRHRESVHRQSAGFSCQVCQQQFYRKDVLQRHLKMLQSVEVRRDLPGCSTDSTVGLPLPPPPPKKHGETPVWDVCAKTFATQKTLTL